MLKNRILSFQNVEQFYPYAVSFLPVCSSLAGHKLWRIVQGPVFDNVRKFVSENVIVKYKICKLIQTNIKRKLWFVIRNIKNKPRFYKIDLIKNKFSEK